MDSQITQRGFELLTFTDSSGYKCSLQKSSSAMDDKVWLGTDDANPQIMTATEGWQPLNVPENTLFNTRMHLTRQQVSDLLPYLTRFAETGDLSDGCEHHAPISIDLSNAKIIPSTVTVK